MSDHTKGKWRFSTGNIGNAIEGYCGKTEFEGDDGYRTIAFYQASVQSSRGIDEQKNKVANGFLIKAAPEMYEALLRCAAILGGIETSKSGLIKALEATRDAMQSAKPT